MKKHVLAVTISVFVLAVAATSCNQLAAEKTPVEEDRVRAEDEVPYEPTWESLAKHGTAPQWYEDAVLGIYFHWGIYSVAGKETRYMRDMYKPGHKTYEYHKEHYGDPLEFGYRDFLPMFTGEKWDPGYWAKLFKTAGADFAGSIGEHHDGYSMWDTKYNKINAMTTGPRRDVLGEMAEALRKEGLRVVTTFHHLRLHWYDAGRELCPDGKGVNDPQYEDLYGPAHEPFDPQEGMWLVGDYIRNPRTRLTDLLPESYVENGYNKIIEVIDKYRPDQLQFDGGTCVRLGEERLKKMLAYYFNSARSWGKEVAVSRGYDRNNPYVPSDIWGKEVMTSRIIPTSCSVQNIEWHFPRLTLHQVNPVRWQTSTPVPGFSWAYVSDEEDKSPEEIYQHVNDLVDGIVDMTSKNGMTLLGVAPRADGTIPEAQVAVLEGLGKWMKVNKKALYGSHWRTHCEEGSLRFVVKDGDLLAIDLERPGVPEVIGGVTAKPGSVVRMQGSDKELSWRQDGSNLVIDELPDPLPCDHAWIFRIKLSCGGK